MSWRFIQSVSLLTLVFTSVSPFSFPDCSSGPLSSNVVCDTSKDPVTRARGLVAEFTVPELIANLVNSAPGVGRLGVPSYNWWNEALHGVAFSPGITFASSGNFSFATSFPQPILMSAAFDDELIKEVATVISTEARAFNNAGRAGLDFWTPNMNPFRDIRWGRGQETPGEDPFRISGYVTNLVQGLQGGIDPTPYLKVAATCKHFAAYDLEDWEGNPRYGFNAVVSTQDLVEYYLQPFQSCVQGAKVAAIMCSYNAVNGVPSCADSYLLQTILREEWGFDGWVVSDCDAIGNIFNDHHFTATFPEAAAAALKAGTDLNCGNTFANQLPTALNQSLVNETDLSTALIRQYTSLVRLGYFDPPKSQPYRSLSWSDVNTPESQALARRAAVEGLVLLKNDGALPLAPELTNIALIGPFANATTQLQGNYFGGAPFLVSPVQAATNAGYQARFAFGTAINSKDTSGFDAAISAAKTADAIIFAGGIDNTIEREEQDRIDIGWPGNQLDLIEELGQLGKPLVVLQFGGGQVDDTNLKTNSKVNAIVWCGYPGQGGDAIFDILTGDASPAGRLPVTQYPADYVNQVPMTDMSLRPSASSPGRTYKWFTGAPVYEFGHGLSYTKFNFGWTQTPNAQLDIANLAASRSLSFKFSINNVGTVTSDYVGLLFVNGSYGPEPYPNKQLVAYTRVKDVHPGSETNVSLEVEVETLARADDNGNLWLYPGQYNFALDTPSQISTMFDLQGQPMQLTHWPQPPAN